MKLPHEDDRLLFAAKSDYSDTIFYHVVSVEGKVFLCYFDGSMLKSFSAPLDSETLIRSYNTRKHHYDESSLL